MAGLSDPYVAPVADHLGYIQLTLDDRDGTVGGMSARGEVRIMSAAGDEVVSRHGDPEVFMSAAWQAKVKAVLDELRAEVATKLNVSAS